MKRIIIADDSGTARMITRRCMEVLGYRDADYVEVPDGQAALEAMQANPADLLITDLTMPRLDGIQLVRRITEDGHFEDTQIIVITSAGNPAKEKEIESMGAAILSKPISPAKLAAVLDPERKAWG